MLDNPNKKRYNKGTNKRGEYKMLFTDEMYDEEYKKDRYFGYLQEMRDEWGDKAKVMTYEEFCEDCDTFGWDFI